MKALLTLIARGLVDHPDEIVIDEIEGDEGTVYEMKVAQADLGKIIGKRGRTARAIRTLVASAATKLRKRIVFEIVE